MPRRGGTGQAATADAARPFSQRRTGAGGRYATRISVAADPSDDAVDELELRVPELLALARDDLDNPSRDERPQDDCAAEPPAAAPSFGLDSSPDAYLKKQTSPAFRMQIVVLRVPRPNVAQALEVPEGTRVSEVLRRISVPPDAVVVLREGTPIPLDATVDAGDELRVVNVFSGG